ncbi:MAG: hypothetical protein HXY30_13690 [Pseudorhodoplanes sp.]|nr:hypothetical protein [Pseudorhodoplanes sp.]
MPGCKDIVGAHEPDNLQRRFLNAINESFRIAERRLADFKDQLSDRTGSPQNGGACEFVGQVAEMPPARTSAFCRPRKAGCCIFIATMFWLEISTPARR